MSMLGEGLKLDRIDATASLYIKVEVVDEEGVANP